MATFITRNNLQSPQAGDTVAFSSRLYTVVSYDNNLREIRISDRLKTFSIGLLSID